MTDIRKSDAQLDAEAAEPLEERNLDSAIGLHRALFAADLNWLQKLHVRDGESGLGPPFSPVFEAYLDGRFGQFPWTKALFALRLTCRKEHRGHTDRDEWNGALCHALVAAVIRSDYSLDMARLKFGLPNEGRAARTLNNALLFIERRLEDSYFRESQRQPVQRTPAEWMSSAYVHRAVGGFHAEDCHNPACRVA